MLSYLPTFTEDEISNRFNNIVFLVGNYNVHVYSYNLVKGWIISGSGESSCRIEDSFITEKIKLNKESCKVNLNNTIGYDVLDNSFRLLSLDNPSGTIDVYKGAIEDDTLIFTNLESDTKTTNNIGEEISFKLIYKSLSASKNQLVVGYTKDKGRTWCPFVKNIYTRI